MPLIKSISSPTLLSPFSMADIETQAQAILARAKDQSTRIMLEAAQQAAELKKQAFAAGLEEGRRTGRIEGIESGRSQGCGEALAEQREQLGLVIASLSGAATAMDKSRAQLESTALADIIRLAIAIARRVTKLTGSASGNVLTANVAEAVKLVVKAADVRIAVNSSQKRMLEDVLPRLKTMWPSLQHVAIVEDDGIAPGGCKVFAGSGTIDADLDSQIDRIASDLLATS